MHELICTCYIHLDSFVFTCILFFPLYVVFYYVTLLYLKCSIVLRVRIKDDEDDENTRQAGLFKNMYCRTTLKSMCLSIRGPVMWNKLYSDLKNSTTVNNV